MFDDFRDVTGLKSSDDVLVYGGVYLAGANSPKVQHARKGKELTRFAQENAVFTRIYVESDVEVTDNHLAKLTGMNVGLLCFFVDGEEHERKVVEYFERNYPWHELWVLNSRSGRLVVTTAHGAPEWMD